MRIVLVSRVYPTLRYGGMAFVCEDRANALADLGHEVVVLTSGGDGSTDEWVGDVQVRYVGGVENQYSDEFAAGCDHWVKQLDPAIVHLESFDNSRPWWLDCGKPVSITLHGFGFGSMLSAWNLLHMDRGLPFRPSAANMLAERDIMAKAARIITVSANDLWMAQDPYALPNVTMVRNPIAPIFYARDLVKPPERRSFLCAAIAKSGNRRFGEARRLGRETETVVNIVDSCTRDRMPDQYDRHSALLLPGLYAKGASLTVDEALARGRPVIAWNTGSIWHDERPGIVRVPPGDLEGLAEAMTGHLPTVDAVTSHGLDHRVNHPAVHADSWLKAVAID